MIDGIRAIQVQADIGDVTNIDGLHFRKDNAGGYTVNGSLHKFHNHGKDNADDYRYTDLEETIRRLGDELAINPDITRITQVEFGVNIILPDVGGVIESAILFGNSTGEMNAKGRFFEFQNYGMKIYKKKDNVLRVEVRIKKMMHLKQKNIYIGTLSDLLNESILNALKTALIDTFSDCMMIHVPDEVIRRLKPDQKMRYWELTNPIFWNRIRRDSSKNFSREKKKCELFIQEIGGTNLKEKLTNQIKEKCDYLLNYSDAKSVGFYQQKNKAEKGDLSDFTNLDNTGKTRQTDNTEKPLRCAGCGRVIEHPRKGQKFCSAKVVGYENAHKCRNTMSNPKNNAHRSIKNVLKIPLLFDLRETIDPKKEKFLNVI